MKRSVEVELEKAERFYNLVRPIHEEIYGKKETNKDFEEKAGRIEGFMLWVLRERGMERYNSTSLNIINYYQALLKEIEMMNVYIGIHQISGRIDFSEFSKLFKSEVN